ncbi:MAG: hypothetical protein ABF665_00960 [Gluconacetobacter sp.]
MTADFRRAFRWDGPSCPESLALHRLDRRFQQVQDEMDTLEAGGLRDTDEYLALGREYAVLHRSCDLLMSTLMAAADE